MIERSSHTSWMGGLKDGKGDLSLECGAYNGSFSFQSRLEDSKEINSEEPDSISRLEKTVNRL